MSLEDLGNIGEFVAAVAVVVSLIYLAVQIGQNTRWLRASLADVHFRGVADWLSNVASNSELGKTFFVGLQQFEDLSDGEQRQFLFLILSLFKTYERLHYQYCQGNVEEALWNREAAPLLLFIQSSVFDTWWKARRDWFQEDFQYEILQSIDIGESLYEAEIFFRHEGSKGYKSSAIKTPDGQIAGYEIRPKFDKEFMGVEDLMQLTYHLNEKTGEIKVKIRLRASIKRLVY